jgi:hypothetical protein
MVEGFSHVMHNAAFWFRRGLTGTNRHHRGRNKGKTIAANGSFISSHCQTVARLTEELSERVLKSSPWASHFFLLCTQQLVFLDPLAVAHSDRGENIRIISARKTTLRERKHYEGEI